MSDSNLSYTFEGTSLYIGGSSPEKVVNIWTPQIGLAVKVERTVIFSESECENWPCGTFLRPPLNYEL